MRRAAMHVGITRQGLALLACLCALNALRRSADELAFGRYANWLWGTASGFVTGMMVALVVVVCVVVAYDRVPPLSRLHVPVLVATVVLSSALGVALLLATEASIRPLYDTTDVWRNVRTMWPRYAVLGGLLTGVYAYLRRAERCSDQARQADQDRIRMLQRMDEARLMMLHAQIEPHFLFNTLATVRRLYRTDHACAARMLENLIRYLAVALPQMRAADSSLGREIDLTQAYLEVQRIRMGRRLAYSIDVHASLRPAAVPPMMVVTLVENAIKHGLAPLPQGGTINVGARREGERLRIDVTDTGRGFAASGGAGAGLANIAARLAAAHGEAARLTFTPNRPRGVTASIAVPYRMPSGSAASPPVAPSRCVQG